MVVDGYLAREGEVLALLGMLLRLLRLNEDRANVRTRQGSSTASRLEEVIEKKIR